MSFKQALMQYKQQIEDNKVQEKIQKMLDEQRSLLKPSTKTLTSKTPYERKEFEEDVLVNGGVTYFPMVVNGKVKKYRIALAKGDCTTVLKYHTRNCEGYRFSVSASSYNDAQKVIDAVYGKGLYSPSAETV